VDSTDGRNPKLVAFAERLTDAWKRAGHPSRAAAAIAAQTTGGYFARLCAGTVEPGITIVERLATAFGIEPGYLAFGIGPINHPSNRGKRPTESRSRKGKS
jgi:hypothetical protein